MTQAITKDMTMGSIIEKYPIAAEIMQSYGLHCFGCHVNVFETLEQGALGHGMPEEQMNEMLAEINKAAGSEPENESEQIHENKDMPPIGLTETAAAKLKQLLVDDKKDYGVRVQVMKGGCAGYTYNMEFTKNPVGDDRVIYDHDVRIIIDSKTFEMLRGVTIDYTETLQGAGFKFSNPNAKSTCGCGKSYS
ncbi:iron-sulfur cluster assembly accessory protein [archaeon]|nr:iron-sulfur cluster assembly accessory protein [archaeon]